VHLAQAFASVSGNEPQPMRMQPSWRSFSGSIARSAARLSASLSTPTRAPVYQQLLGFRRRSLWERISVKNLSCWACYRDTSPQSIALRLRLNPEACCFTTDHCTRVLRGANEESRFSEIRFSAFIRLTTHCTPRACGQQKQRGSGKWLRAPGPTLSFQGLQAAR
jgi:hypothetical protein